MILSFINDIVCYCYIPQPPQSPSAGISIHLEPVPVTSLQPVPVTSLQTFRQILEHGHQLSDVPKPAPPEESHTDEVHMQ